MNLIMWDRNKYRELKKAAYTIAAEAYLRPYSEIDEQLPDSFFDMTFKQRAEYAKQHVWDCMHIEDGYSMLRIIDKTVVCQWNEWRKQGMLPDNAPPVLEVAIFPDDIVH